MSEIKKLDLSNKKDRAIFIDVAFEIYKNDPLFCPQLRMEQDALLSPKHPFAETAEVQAFVALKDGQLAGRIMAIQNKAWNAFHEDQCGHFGYFECINDLEVAKLLLNTAEEWLKQRGFTSALGPFNPSTNYECGLLIKGYDDPPQIMMTYNPAYYADLFEKLGLNKAKDLIAYNIDAHFQMPDIINRIAARIEKSSKITFRHLDKSKWDNEVHTMYEIYNSAWEKNWGFVPMTKKEFEKSAEGLKMVVNEKLIHFVYVENEPAGFIITLPDLNQIFIKNKSGSLNPLVLYRLLTNKKRINRTRVITLGVKEKFRKMGLETLLYKHNHEAIKAQGCFNEIEMSWILEDNLPMNKPLLTMGAVPYKTYRLYSKSI